MVNLDVDFQQLVMSVPSRGLYDCELCKLSLDYVDRNFQLRSNCLGLLCRTEVHATILFNQGDHKKSPSHHMRRLLDLPIQIHISSSVAS